MRAYNEDVQAALGGTVWASGCTSWYQQADGKNVTLWPWSTWRYCYWLRTRRVDPVDYRLARCDEARSQVPQAVSGLVI